MLCKVSFCMKYLSKKIFLPDFGFCGFKKNGAAAKGKANCRFFPRPIFAISK